MCRYADKTDDKKIGEFIILIMITYCYSASP